MKLKRVYPKHGRYWFVDTAGKWHKLTRVDEGEAALLRALAKRKDAPPVRPQSVQDLARKWRAAFLSGYAQSTQDDYDLMLGKIELGFQDHDVAEVVPGDVWDFVWQWKDAPRQAHKYLHLLSMMFKHACAPLRWRRDNPCDQVDAPDLGPKRDRYITDTEFHAIRRGALRSKNGSKVPSGEIIVCAIDLAYLTFQRQGEIRRLRDKDMDAEWLYFRPSKSESTTGARVKWRRSQPIDAVLERAKAFGKVKPLDGTVIHNLRGKAYTKSGLYTAWARACERAGVLDAHFHDLRAKAQTDAKAAGYTIEQIQEGATHADPETTRGYIKRREVAESAIELSMPKLDTPTGT